MKAEIQTAFVCLLFLAIGSMMAGTAGYWYGMAKGYERIIGDMQQRTFIK